jgi:hypothetical protein
MLSHSGEEKIANDVTVTVDLFLARWYLEIRTGTEGLKSSPHVASSFSPRKSCQLPVRKAPWNDSHFRTHEAHLSALMGAACSMSIKSWRAQSFLLTGTLFPHLCYTKFTSNHVS